MLLTEISRLQRHQILALTMSDWWWDIYSFLCNTICFSPEIESRENYYRVKFLTYPWKPSWRRMTKDISAHCDQKTLMQLSDCSLKVSKQKCTWADEKWTHVLWFLNQNNNNNNNKKSQMFDINFRERKIERSENLPTYCTIFRKFTKIFLLFHSVWRYKE